MPCAGQVVSEVTVVSAQPRELERLGGWERRLGRASGLLHRGTEPDVVRNYVLIQPGNRCVELYRAESERVLRTQPFFADARIRVLPSSGDSVKLEVSTEEELRPNVGLRLENGQLTRLRLGTSNYEGRAISVTALYRKGFHYRDGFGVRVADFQPFDRPWILNLEAIRDPLGGSWVASIGEPLYTELHAHSWYVGAERRRAHHGFRRSDGPDAAVDFDRTRWLAGSAWRIGTSTRAAFIGPVATGDHSVDHGGPVIVSDTGLLPYTGPGLADENLEYSTLRAGALLGFHWLRYTVARGFDALSGPQDLQSGVEVLALGARSLRTTGNSREDMLLGGSFYGGIASEDRLLAVVADAEARKELGEGERWTGTVLSTRAAWYRRPRLGRLTTVSAEFSGAWGPRLPIQVTLSERDFGLRGFGGASVGGEQRFVTRVEQRWVAVAEDSRIDVGAALFADAGRLWAGEAPFGRTTGWQASAGVSLLAAVPRGARHVWRLELAVPITDAGRPNGYELRATITDFTRHFWRDPGDVARVREGPLLSRVLGGM